MEPSGFKLTIGDKMKLKCFCGNVYQARQADIKRGWAKTCSKSCAAIKREFGRKNAVCAETGKKIKWGNKPNYSYRSENNSKLRAKEKSFDGEYHYGDEVDTFNVL